MMLGEDRRRTDNVSSACPPEARQKPLKTWEGRTGFPIVFSSPPLPVRGRLEPEGETPLKRGLPLRGSGRFCLPTTSHKKD